MPRFPRWRRSVTVAARLGGPVCLAVLSALFAATPASAGATGPAVVTLPVVTSVSPPVGPPGGGTTVTIAGQYLSGAVAVVFGDVTASSFTVDGDGSLTAVSPPHAGGTVDVRVTTAAGTSAASSAGQFTYALTGASPPPPASASGYDLVGSDGGVFVFPQGRSSGFYGSLPGLGTAVSDIVGMVSSPGGGGYFLVGADGGVFAFGDAPFLGSLPGSGVRVDDVVGIAATPSGGGYWVVAADGTVYAFGAAGSDGSVSGSPSPVSAIAATGDGGGYWIVTRNGSVYCFGDAGYFGSLTGSGLVPAHPVVGLVPTADAQGYWLIGSDGGIFAFGDAPFVGSLPGLGVTVGDVVGAVPPTG